MMVGKGNQNVFLIQIDALSFAGFEISEFEISRFDRTVAYSRDIQSPTISYSNKSGVSNSRPGIT